jgi:hypothetical protein
MTEQEHRRRLAFADVRLAAALLGGAHDVLADFLPPFAASSLERIAKDALVLRDQLVALDPLERPRAGVTIPEYGTHPDSPDSAAAQGADPA